MNHSNSYVELDDSTQRGAPDNVQVIESILAHGFRWLRFPAFMESAYKTYHANYYLKYNRLTVFVGLVMVLLLGVLDVLFLKEQLIQAVWIRYVWATPFMLVLAGISLMHYFEKQQQSVLVLLLLSIATVTITLITIASADVAHLYFSGLLLVIIFGFCLARLFFWYAIITAIAIGIFYNMATLWMAPEPLAMYLAHNFFYWGACVLALLCNYHLEHGNRTEYLQTQLLTAQKENLRKANTLLQTLASVDGLTGLANRRHFDETFAHEWRRAQRVGHSLVILMLDIDFFKKYNDTYGHQAGDDCLSRVAACLRSCLKRPGDLIARYGGEEFVVLMPDLDQDGAQAIATQMCKQVEALAIAHEASMVSHVVTISVGAASCVPKVSSTPAQLIADADDALYDAKSAGRNRVIVSMV